MELSQAVAGIDIGSRSIELVVWNGASLERQVKAAHDL